MNGLTFAFSQNKNSKKENTPYKRQRELNTYIIIDFNITDWK
jgi:hypothetical protein